MLSQTLFHSLCKVVTACGLCAFFSASAQAYTIQTVYKSEHFAVNQVILEEHETLDAPTQSSITGDIQAQNRLNHLYQSTTAIFPYGSPGYTGKINTPLDAVLTISNFGTGKDRIVFNRNLNYATDAGIYLSYDQIIEMINQRLLNSLMLELKEVPVVLTNVPVSYQGFDKTINSYFISAIDDGLVLDMRIDDSVYYNKESFFPVDGKYVLNDSCKVDVLLFIDRMADKIPFFISGRAALNKVTCPKNIVTNQQ